MSTYQVLQSDIIPAQKGSAFKLLKGQLLKVIDLEGEQVSDLFCFSACNQSDALSSGRSIDYNDTIYLTTNHKLYSNFGEVMLTIVKDTCGRHDFLVTPCSLQMFKMISGKDDYHPSCQENLSRSLKEFGIEDALITTSFNIFMNVPVSGDGKIQVKAPLSKAGDHICFRAEMDLIVGLTACSDEGTNNGRCKPTQYEIYSAH